jgi:hypothetical protein
MRRSRPHKQEATNEKPPHQDKPRRLQAGALSCLYQDGFLRYISYGDKELVRMFYYAVRDQHWQTVSSRMLEELITDCRDHFNISCKQLYEVGEIRYEATVTFEGRVDNRISCSFHGRALQTSSMNRIGICIHLPLSCQTAPCTILTTEGKRQVTHFPDLISPHQPFHRLKAIEWQVPGQPVADLSFSGDVFEAEDQRNWTDASFKFYCPPLDRPFPVVVEKNAELRQKVTFSITNTIDPLPKSLEIPAQPIAFSCNGARHRFPALGCSTPAPYESLTRQQAQLLRSMPFTHYREDVMLDNTWEKGWKRTLKDQRLLRLPLELVLYFNGEPPMLPASFPKALAKASALINSILLLHIDHQYTPAKVISSILPVLRDVCPKASIGAGSDAWFAGWNRHFTPIEGLDFTAFAISPQVHATDTTTLTENLVAQADTIRTARARCGPLNIHVSPVTLKRRHNPDALTPDHRQLPPSLTTDPRQHTLFAAAWTAVSLRYLAGADSISYFESIGPRGILSAPSRRRWLRQSPPPSSPVSLLLQQIADFHPEFILETFSSKPLQVDGVALQKQAGSTLMVLANFTANLQDVRVGPLLKPRFFKILWSDDDMQTFGQEKWKKADATTDGRCTLLPYSLTFMTNDEPHDRKAPY